MLPAEPSPEDLAPEAGTGSAHSKFPPVLMCRAANCSRALSLAVKSVWMGVLVASWELLSKEIQRKDPVPRLGNQVGRDADGIHPPFLSPTAKIPVTKGQRECNQIQLVYSAAVSFSSCPASNPAWAFSFFPSACQYISYPAALLGGARHNSFTFFN